MTEDRETRGAELGDLAAELASDRAAGASDEDRAAVGEIADGRKIGLDRVAAQKVFDLDVAKG